MKKQKKIVLSAGGTGGHLFPAQSLAKSFSDWEILFVAGGLSRCRYFDQHLFSFSEITCSTFSFSQPLNVLKGGIKIVKGVAESKKILRQFSPDLVVGFGSFFTLPVLLAAKMERIPILLHEQNAIPGKVNKMFSRFAHTTAITFPHSAKHLKGNLVEVAFPLRSKTEAIDPWEYFGLSSNLLTLLVFGGSQGAAVLNRLFLQCLPMLPKMQVLHFTGKEESVEEAKRTYALHDIPACVKSFETHMDLAMQIADLAICRAGASTIAELIEHQVPALLIPFPFATENHQEKNADYFVKEVKGGELLIERGLDASNLARTISHMLSSIEIKRRNIEEFKSTHQTQNLVNLIEEMYRCLKK